MVFYIHTYIDADRRDVVLVPNVTVGNNTVVQSVLRTLKPGDSILMLSLAYGKSIYKILACMRMDNEHRVSHCDSLLSCAFSRHACIAMSSSEN